MVVTIRKTWVNDSFMYFILTFTIAFHVWLAVFICPFKHSVLHQKGLTGMKLLTFDNSTLTLK